MDKQFFEHIYKMKKLINDVGTCALEIDCAEQIDWAVYDWDDLVNASLIFNHVMSNIIISKYMKGWLDVKTSTSKILEYAQAFREFIITHTGLDTHVLVTNQIKKKNGQSVW